MPIFQFYAICLMYVNSALLGCVACVLLDKT